ncbi:MAG TPA: cystathionine gamma-synthase [Candidatus Krumholzibacteria bacterium]|jgi:cystathionine beta-lyase/cystathionine gamma-synthase|nr:cystathionine gamma-synthase [Candidatus Krumholzibacteria bacterium]
MGFSTDAVHAGQDPDPRTGAVIPPLYQTSTYQQEGLGKPRLGYEYARTQNPTRTALETNMAALEGGQHAFAFASGLAAIGTLLQLLQAGDHVVCTDNVYGGTYRLADKVWRRFGLQFSFVDTSRPEEVVRVCGERTRLLLVETPTNPILTLSDLTALSRLARERRMWLAVDNTFMTPFFQRPLQRGADIVVHSTTKYLNGHSDMVGGVVVVNDSALAERLRFLQNAVGAVPGPFDCWLLLRGVKTLALRMMQHDRSARELARILASHPKVRKIHYPGLATHPQHELACTQATGFGGMISIDVGGREHAKLFMEGLRLFLLAESLGGVESLVCHPASMTHASVPEAERERLGISAGLVRLSVGIEDVEDLVQDVEQALERVPAVAHV